MNIDRALDYLCGGSFDVNYKEDLKLTESVNVEKTFIQQFSDVYNLFHNYELNESESDQLDSLDIEDELYVIQEALESIKQKTMLKEDIGSMLAIAVPGIAFLTTALVKAFANSSGDIKVPTKVANTIHDVSQFLTSGKEKERRAVIKAHLTRNNPNLDPDTVEKFIDKAIEDADKDPTRKYIAKQKDSRISGKGDTDFAAINRARFNLK